MTTRIAIVGMGKIARDQHLAAIAGDPAFTLAAVVDPAGGAPAGVPAFADLDALIAAGGIDAVALCTPPQVRAPLVARAVAAGLHVLMEKPPAATVSEADAIAGLARPGGPTLFAAWHSRFAPAVAPARGWAAGRAIAAGAIRWREDAHRWHPGQRWPWRPGGFGVYDPGINALSILTALLAPPIAVARAHHDIPANAHAPVAATIGLASGGATIAGEFSALQKGGEQWEIELVGADGARLLLADGGARAWVDGAAVPCGPAAEYPGLYRRFAALIAGGRSEVDLAPLKLVADAFMLATVARIDPFDP